MSTFAGPSVVQALDATLARARRRWRRRRLLRALAIVAAVLLLGVLGAAFLVRESGFDTSVIARLRIGLALALVVATLLAVAAAFVRRADRGEIARYVEEVDPALDGALVTASDPRIAASAPEFVARLSEQVVPRAERATGRRRVDVRRDLVALGVLATAVTTFVATMLSGPPELGRALRLLVAAPGTAAAAALPYIAVEPGNVDLPEHADLAVAATLGNFDADDVVLVVRRGGWLAGREERVPMARDQEGRWSARLFDLDTLAEYQVEAGGIHSPRYTVTVSPLPYVSRLDLLYRYPAYTGMAPDTVADGGDIAALRGTTVELAVTTTLPPRAGRLVVENGDTVALAPLDGGGALAGTLTVRTPGFYRVELQTADGRWHPASLDYVIDVVPDAEPLVRMSRPGRDVQATALEELYLEAEARDDFGVAALELVISVNGGPDQVVPLWRGGAPGRREVSAGHTLYLEEMELQPGDLVAYHARARDADAVQGAKTAHTDIYFVTIRPFSRDYRQGQQGGMPQQGGGEQPSDIVRVQREIVAGTFNASRDRSRIGESEYRERVGTLALSQGRLEEEVRALIGRIQQRGFLSGDTTLVRLAGLLDTAAVTMGESEGRLTQRDADGALGHARRALTYAQRAEALFREVTVTFGGQPGGSPGGGEPQRAEDLADLFSLETDKLQNQYETLQRSADRQAALDREVDELRERLRQLAARQQRENEEARRLLDSLARAGARATGGGSSGSASQRALAAEAEQEARRLERLARERQSPALQESAQRLRDAAEAMRQAAAGSRAGDPRRAAEALDRLRDASRALEREERASLGESLDRAAETARRLERDQQEAAARAASETQAARQSPQARQRAQQERLARADAVTALERELDRVARDARRERPEAARAAQEAANAIRGERIADKLRYSADRVGVLDPASATGLEEMIAENLAGVRERVERARREAAAAEGRDPASALDRARSLVRGLESLRDRSEQGGQPGAPGLQQGRDGQQGGEAMGGEGSGGRGAEQPEGGVRAGSTISPGGGGVGVVPSGAPVADRQRARELAERRAEAEQLRRDLARMGMDVGEVDRLLEQMRELERRRVSDDPEEVRRLQAALVDGWKLVEFRLLRATLAREGDPPIERRLEAIPPDYREAVERYYRALAGRRDEGAP